MTVSANNNTSILKYTGLNCGLNREKKGTAKIEEERK